MAYPEIRNGQNLEAENHRRIVITGMGTVNPLGLNVPDFWRNLVAGKSGISSIDLPHTNVKVAGIIPDFKPEVFLAGLVEPKDRKKLSRPVQLAVTAAAEALMDAGLLDENKRIIPGIELDRFGTIVGTGIGGAVDIVEVGQKLEQGKRVFPSDLFRSEPERVASVVSMVFGLKGPTFSPSAACATGNMAGTLGRNEIFLENADLMLVGGVEACIHSTPLALFESATALSLETNPEKASRPFDKKRGGFVMSEGAGIYILESLEHAKKRGARIYAELVGYGNTADAYHDTYPSEEGQRRAIRLALRGIDLDSQIIFVNTHGTGTIPGDPVEILSIRKELPEKNIYVSAPKSSIGHTVGGAGAIEGIISMKALNEGVLPPTLNLDDPIEEAEGINMIPNEAIMVEGVEYSLNDSFGFGGQNSVIAFARFRG